MSKLKQSSSGSTRDNTVVYLDLDSILDTRLGTLALYDPELATKVLASGNYFKRTSDTFAGLSKEDFDKLYEKRTVETLKRSMVTNVSFFLQRLVKDALSAAAVSDSNGDTFTLEVNIYPYELTEDELEMLVGCIRHITFSTCSINVISRHASEFTLKQCKEDYDIMIMYDYEKFLIAHEKEFAECRMPSVSLVAPEMFKAKVPTTEEITELKMAQYNPFRITEKSLAVAIGLKLMPISLFCINEKLTGSQKDDILRRVSYTEQDILDAIKQEEFDVVHDAPLPEVPPIDRNSESDDYDLL